MKRQRFSILNSAVDTEEKLFSSATRAASTAENAVREMWDELIQLITRGGPMDLIFHGALRILSDIPLRVRARLADDFLTIASRTHSQAVANLNRHIPVKVLTKPPTVEKESESRSMLQFLLPNPTEPELLQVIYQGNWVGRLQSATSLASPSTLANSIASGVLLGKTPAQIAREILPAVQGVQSTARRVARTEGLRIAHQIQYQAYEGLGDMVVGYQVHAVLDRATRPEHRKRDGTIYYKTPKPGQRSMAECPHPPMEADGTYAFNCRCFLTPVFGDLDVIAPLAPSS